MSAPVVYTSVDASAPTLDGSAGSLTTLLQACLVTGYGAKAAAGWTRPYVSGNESAFQQGGGNQMFLYVNGTPGWNTTSRACSLRAYESMSSVNTGTDPFPTVAQLTNAIQVSVQNQDGTGPARPWVLVADDRTLYLMIDFSGTTVYEMFCFGDLYSYKAGDSYRTFIGGSSNAIFSGRSAFNYLSSAITTSQSSGGTYIARDRSGTNKSYAYGLHGDRSVHVAGGLTNSSIMRGTLPYPNPAGGSIWLAPIYLHDANDPSNRGKIRGLWQWLHQSSGIADRDTFSGTGEFAGKTFLVVKGINLSGDVTGVWVLETSNTWLTN